MTAYRAIGAAASALLLAACASAGESAGESPGDAAAGYPRAIDNCGTDVTFDAPPERVTLLESAPVTILSGLGVFDHVQSKAGSFPLEYYDDDLARQVDDVEAFSDDIDGAGHLMISQEEVVAQRPDLVLGLPDGITREGLADAGAAALVQEVYCDEADQEAAFDQLYAEVERYGEIFDRRAQAEDLNAELAERVAAVEADSGDEDRSAAVLYPTVGGGPLYAYGIGSMAHPQVETAGFENVFADTDERVFEVQTEELIARDPDVVVVLYQGGRFEAEDAMVQLPGIESVSAVADGDVHYQLFNFTEPASPLVVDGIEQIAERFETVQSETGD